MDDLKTLFEASCLDEPGHLPAAVRLDAGKRAVRRRRATIVGSALAALTVIGASGYAATQGPGGDRTDPAGPGPSPTRAEGPVEYATLAPPEELDKANGALYLTCLQSVDRDDEAGRALFTKGETPELMSWSNSGRTAQFMFRSEDRKYVGLCQPDVKGDQNATASVSVFRIGQAPSNTEGTYEQYLTDNCDNGGACTKWTFGFAAVVSPKVAEIRLRTVDGQRKEIPVKDGFVVFDLAGKLPDGDNSRLITSMAFHDKAGRELGRSSANDEFLTDVPGYPMRYDLTKAVGLSSPDDDQTDTEPPDFPELTGQQVADACATAGDSSAKANLLLFAGKPMPPVAMTQLEGHVYALFASANGKYWGDCTWDGGDPGPGARLEVFPTDGPSWEKGPGSSSSSDYCGSCAVVVFAEKMHPEVAAVEVDYTDGHTDRAEVKAQGLVVLGRVVKDASWDGSGTQPIAGIRYYNEAGKLIAQSKHPQPAGVGSLLDYPEAATNEPINFDMATGAFRD